MDTYIRIHAYAYMHTYAPTDEGPPCGWIHTYAYMHTHRHIHTYIYMFINMFLDILNIFFAQLHHTSSLPVLASCIQYQSAFVSTSALLQASALQLASALLLVSVSVCKLVSFTTTVSLLYRGEPCSQFYH